MKHNKTHMIVSNEFQGVARFEKAASNRRDRQEHRGFLRDCNEQIPELAAYIFSLRKRPYMGSGFHYELEKALGNAMRACNNHERVLDFSTIIIDEVLWESLTERVSEIKKELGDE